MFNRMGQGMDGQMAPAADPSVPAGAPTDTVGPKMGAGAPSLGLAGAGMGQMQGSATGAPRKPGMGSGLIERILAQRAMGGLGKGMPQPGGAFGVMAQRMGPKPSMGPYNGGFGMMPKKPAVPGAPMGAPPAAPAAPAAPSMTPDQLPDSGPAGF